MRKGNEREAARGLFKGCITLFIIQHCFVEYKERVKRVQISHDFCTRLILPTARKIKTLGKSEFWGNENVG